uniref:Uncharacterized protein n=1 Tax=Lactuca sativa TaxID=4236 RepID=A0A9R1UG77_LACSA|nr:hypothetical protein LSAT_V11C900484170 [Lactuca sativa]
MDAPLIEVAFQRCLLEEKLRHETHQHIDGIDKKRLSKYQYTKCLQLGNGTGVDKKVIADVSEGLEKHRLLYVMRCDCMVQWTAAIGMVAVERMKRVKAVVKEFDAR